MAVSLRKFSCFVGVNGVLVLNDGTERFSIECRKTKTKTKTKTKVISLASRNRYKHQARENACGRQNTIGFGLDSHWLRKWREFC